MAQEGVLTAAEQRKAEAKEEEKLRKRSALVRASPRLLPYGTPEELAEMVGRVRFMVHGGDKLADKEIWALAEASFMLGLNPIIGECWLLKGLGFMPGIKGLRRPGRKQFAERDAHEFLYFEAITETTDFELYKIPLGSLAFFCKGTVSDKRRSQAEDAKVWRDALGPDAPYEVILERVGPPTETIGIGFVTAEQMEELDNPRWYHVCNANPDANTVHVYKKFQRELRGHDPCPDCEKKSYAKTNAMPHTQRAQKRAEAHWWKQECDLPFNVLPSGTGFAEELNFDGMFPDSKTLEGSFLPDSLKTGEEVENYRELQKESDENSDKLDEMDKDELQSRATDAEETLYSNDEEEDPKAQRRKPSFWRDDVLQAIVECGYADNDFEAAGMLSHSAFHPSVGVDPAIFYSKHYRANRDEDLEPAKAGAKAFKKYTEEFGKGNG